MLPQLTPLAFGADNDLHGNKIIVVRCSFWSLRILSNEMCNSVKDCFKMLIMVSFKEKVQVHMPSKNIKKMTWFSECPESEVRFIMPRARVRTSDSKDTRKYMNLVWFGSEVRLVSLPQK